MKWTKTEEIEFDLENLPYEVYEQMAEAFLGDLDAWFWFDGTFGFTHEWSNDLTNKTWSLETLAKQTVDRGLKNDQMQMMLVELEKAATVLRTALTPNVQAEGAAHDLSRSSLRAPGSAARDSEKDSGLD